MLFHSENRQKIWWGREVKLWEQMPLPDVWENSWYLWVFAFGTSSCLYYEIIHCEISRLRLTITSLPRRTESGDLSLNVWPLGLGSLEHLLGGSRKISSFRWDLHLKKGFIIIVLFLSVRAWQTFSGTHLWFVAQISHFVFVKLDFLCQFFYHFGNEWKLGFVPWIPHIAFVNQCWLSTHWKQKVNTQIHIYTNCWTRRGWLSIPRCFLNFKTT